MVTAKKAVQAVSIIVIIGFISKILGFVRELVIANYFGAGSAMDAFGIANEVPGILLSGLGGAITTTFIPAFTKKVEEAGMPEALNFSQKIFTWFTLAGLVISGLGFVWALPITHLLAPKFSPENMQLAANLTRILIISGVFMLLNGLCTGLLQARENFVIPALVGFPLNLAVIFSVILLSRTYGIYALAIGTVLSIVAQMIFQVPSLCRTGFRFIPSLDYSDPDIRRLASLILPVFAGTMILQANTIVDRMFASGLPAGSIAAINYANRINGLLVGMVAMAISTVALPALSQAAATKDFPRLRSMMLYSTQGMNMLIIPMTVGMVVLRVPLVRLLFQRGAFDAHATAVTALALLYLSLGLFAYALRDIFSKVFYSLQDTLTPMLNSGVTIIVNIILIIILTPKFGLAGLAGATSISGVFSGLQLILRLKRKIGSVNGWAIAVSFFKITTASLVMGVLIALAYPPVRGAFSGPGFFPQLVSLTLVTILGAFVYM
ncbi:MAG TPA: murein biosynthesis integral membrane protein MurJ, partial [Bacillota bacterium]|nr:murein biosynthesis integral membrane protein MurJ [Bacillota bacterium]